MSARIISSLLVCTLLWVAGLALADRINDLHPFGTSWTMAFGALWGALCDKVRKLWMGLL